jgi:hypothetical protein
VLVHVNSQPCNMQKSQPQPQQDGTAPVAPATAEVIQGLRDKCEKAPKHGVNGKYLIIQAARLLAQQEQARKSDSSDAGASSPPCCTPWAYHHLCCCSCAFLKSGAMQLPADMSTLPACCSRQKGFVLEPRRQTQAACNYPHSTATKSSWPASTYW